MTESNEHIQLLDKLAEIKQGLAVTTVKTTGIETSVSEIKAELKDIRLSFLTHSEYEIRHKQLQDEMREMLNQITKLDARISVLENFKSMLFGGLVLSNVIIVPIIIWLVIRQLSH